jgi:predicted phosphate transport protein (TIGR00153 family)
VSIFIQKKEKPIVELFKQHAEKVLETVGAAHEAFAFYIEGNADESRRLTKKIHECEHEADIIERKVEMEMFAGAFMPAVREPLYLMLEFVDKVAKRAEIIGDFLTLVHPNIPPEIHEHVKRMWNLTYECGKELKDGIYNLFDQVDLVFKNTAEVENLESSVDQYARDALTMIFKKMDFEKFSHRMMLREMVMHISEVTNRMVDASEKLDLIALRMRL